VVELSLFVGYGWSRFMAFLQLLREFDTLIRYMVTYVCADKSFAALLVMFVSNPD